MNTVTKLQPGCLLGWLRGFFRGHFFGTPRHRSQERPRCRRVWPRLPRVRPQLRRDARLRHTCPRDAHAYATPACAMMCGPVSATLSPARQPACLRDVLRLRDARLLEPATLCRPATLCACAYARNCGRAGGRGPVASLSRRQRGRARRGPPWPLIVASLR